MRNRMLKPIRGAVLLLAVAAPAIAAAAPAIEWRQRETTEFQPARGETLTIPYRLHESGTVRLVLRSADDDPVRAFNARELEPGRHEWTWDGRDDQGEIVPDEAWHPVLRCDCASGDVVLDPRKDSGGVVLDDLDTRLANDGTISYRLAEAARVLVRVGIKGGAMIRALDTWSPRKAGRVRLAWDGTGADGQARVLDHPDLAVLVRGYALPDHTIITSGNDALGYPAYRERRGWSVPDFDPDSVAFERDGQRLAREASMPQSLLRDPAASIEIIDGIDGRSGGLPVIEGGATFRVDMPPGDRWLMQQSVYEVGFFLDYRFVSEEETGYTPISWRWGVNAEPGTHTMTVNLSGLWGQVGVATVRFIVPEEDAKR